MRRRKGLKESRWLFLGFVFFGSLGYLALYGGGCVKPYDRQAMLKDIADLVIVPSYQKVADLAAAFESESLLFCKAPDLAGMAKLQTKWADTRQAWKRIEPLDFGPVMDLRLRSFFDWSPASEDGIEQEIQGSSSLDAKALEGFGANKRGLLAAEYLLFQPDGGGGDAAVLAKFQEAGGKGERRCSYLKALASVMTTKAKAVAEAWVAGKQGYYEDFVQAGIKSQAFPTQQGPLDAIINQWIASVDSIVEMKLGKPLGKKGGEIQPVLVEAQRSGRSKDDLLATLDGIKRLYELQAEAKDSHSIRGLLFSRSLTALDAKLQGDLAAAVAAIQAIQPPLQKALVTDKAKVEAAWEACRQLRLTLSVELTAALGTLVTFNDNDGD